MQSLNWYSRRLRAMPAGEVWWRLGGKVRDAVDRCLAPARRRPIPLDRIAEGNGQQLAARSEVVGPCRSELAGQAFAESLAIWRASAVEQADPIAANRLRLFDLETCDLGYGIDWNYEYKAGKQTPMGFAGSIDYRDYAVTGDCKFVWEPNRHQHLVVLGRAYRLTGDRRYAEAVAEHLESWLAQCPFGQGMNWRSPLELAIRLINWVWAIELIRPSNVIGPDRMKRLIEAVYRHLWEISRKYSRFSSANNHLIGEAAGVYIASSYFQSLKQAKPWRQEAWEILSREIMRQTYADGGTREQAMGYHLFVLEFFLLAGLAASHLGEPFPQAYWDRLERMFEFLAAFTEGGGRLCLFGDADDGYVLDLGGREDPAHALLGVGAVLFERGDFKAMAGGSIEPVYWLLGSEGLTAHAAVAEPDKRAGLRSRMLARSGYYLLQSGGADGAPSISASFDCGNLGFGPLAAHGHADALSVTLKVAGSDVLVDPGTYDYFTYRRWRDYFRSTRAHNTVVIDGQDQSEMLGSFLWGSRARARCVRWVPTDTGGTVVGEHDGYRRLSGSVSHRRTVTLDGRAGQVGLLDQLRGAGRHEACVCLHLGEGCALKRSSGNRFEFACDGHRVIIELDERLTAAVYHGSDDPIAGWVSRGYHQKVATTTLFGACAWQDRLETRTRISIL